jgi:phosphatidylserine decarboxylase
MFVRAARHVGGWLPAEQRALEAWLAGKAEQVAARGGGPPFHPVIEEFRELIDSDPIARLYLTEMIDQVPHTKPYTQRHLRSVEQMLELIDAVLTEAPEYNDTELVGAPLNAILDWAMGTPAGFAAFRDERVNAMIRKVLRAWAEFLDSPDSLYVLNDSPTGWKSPAAMRAVGMDQYRYDPDDEHWGFSSWNDFFTRRFKEGERPIAAPDDGRVVVNACESTPYAIATGVKRQDRFWIKRQPYSLQDMLAGDESVEEFVGGSVYQAFLSALDYHRWHSPVSGTVRKAFVQPGTYYSEAEAEGEDPAGPNDSQGYIAHVATRALIFIEADDPAIGLMCMMPVGMAEVSSCVIHPHVTAGYRVEKGEEVGCFQYGGSTHCLVFRPGAIAEFAAGAVPQPGNPEAAPVRLGAHLATAAEAG